MASNIETYPFSGCFLLFKLEVFHRFLGKNYVIEAILLPLEVISHIFSQSLDLRFIVLCF